LPPLDPPALTPWRTTPSALPIRDLTLNETFDEFGRLAQQIGTDKLPDDAPQGMYGREYCDAPTEVVAAGSTEVWRIFNLTADAHPLHFHLANVQVVSRQPFDARRYAGTPAFRGRAVPPAPNEIGWKETVVMFPGECTTVLMKFDLPSDPIIPVTQGGVTTNNTYSPGISTRTGVSGHEYVWHCHILEHEEHDMMRPLIVV
jgi:spore coat protein A